MLSYTDLQVVFILSSITFITLIILLTINNNKLIDRVKELEDKLDNNLKK